jgi:hypothetical protein
MVHVVPQILFRAATEQTCGAEVMLLLESLNRTVANDVVSEVQNFQDIELTQPKQRPVLD